MRYKVKIKHNGGSLHRWWLVKRSNVVGFQLHREEGPAKEIVQLYETRKYSWVHNYYYLRDHQYRKWHTWHNALKYKSYSKTNRGMI